ncbi:MAG: hypothetical protein ACLGH6_12125 [Gammaproteobacteria bacterium]
MTGPWDIRLPPPITPVQPSRRIEERTTPRRRRPGQPDDDADRDRQRERDDDDPNHIDEYA